MSRNLYKSYWVAVDEDDKCIIDSNSRVSQRIEEWEAIHQRQQAQNAEYDENGEEDAEFVSGLGGEAIDALLADGEAGEENRGGVIKATSVDQGPDLEEIKAQAQEIIDSAQAEADEIKETARREIEAERRTAIEAGKQQGYNEGYQQGLSEADEMKQAVEAEKHKLEADYEQLVEELEPRFVDAITAVYNHIFNVDLSDNRDILVHLIDSTLRKVESSRTFIVHVSSEDYPYVNMQKQSLVEGAIAGRGIIEIIEDIALSKGACLIETDGGIFDCGIGTQLEELTKKLRVLSFEKDT
ncbi:MAG: FliH/SctL family protein [Lachnospiraceae bacterium]